MRHSRLPLLLVALLAVGLAAAQQPPPPGDPAPKAKQGKKAKGKQPKDAGPSDPVADQIAADERTLREVKEKFDPASLLEYFKKRTYADADPKRLDQLVRDLGDRSFSVREKAHANLIELGASAMAAVKEAASVAADWEVRKRALDIRRRIEEQADPAIQAAVARLIGARKPAGAPPVLLNYLPFAADEYVVDEICKALAEVTVTEGKVDPAVVAALTDKLSVKRGAAGYALVHAGAKGELVAVRKLLGDREAPVRLRVALALVTRERDKDAVAGLIDVMEHLPPEKLWQAEEMLIRIAGDKAPQVSLGTDAAGREKARKAWGDWWAGVKDTVDMAKLELQQAFLGYTLVVQRTFNKVVGGVRQPATGQVSELDAGGKNVRWKMDIPTYPVDAEVIGPDRVLVAEFQGMRVSERNFKGEVKWEKQVNGNPTAAQRLANGNTFVVMQNRLVEYDRTGKEVYQLDRPQHDVFRGRKLRNGDVVFITAQGQLSRVDPRNNKTLVSFNVGQMGSQFGGFEVLPNGNYLVPVYGNQRVVEFDPTGKEVWTANVQFPTSAQRLPNGNTLVSSQVSRKVVELDRNGQEVWSYTADGQVFMARRR